jgi:putative oxidoreductase
VSVGILILRVVVGLTMAAHGAQKLFGWFEGPGFAGMSGMLEKMGFRSAKLFAALIVAAEVGGGLLLAAGFLTPLGVAAVVGVMIGAIATVHWTNGFFSTKGGYEFNLVLTAAAIAIAFTGPGLYSVDGLLGWTLFGAQWAVLSLVVGGLAASAVLASRNRPASTFPSKEGELPRGDATERTDVAA